MGIPRAIVSFFWTLNILIVLPVVPSPGKIILYSEMIQNPCHHCICKSFNSLGKGVKGGTWRHDRGTGTARLCHIFKVYPVQRGLPWQKNQGAFLFQTDIGRPCDEVVCKTRSNRSKGFHGTGSNDHAMVNKWTTCRPGGKVVLAENIKIRPRVKNRSFQYEKFFHTAVTGEYGFVLKHPDAAVRDYCNDMIWAFKKCF